MGLGCMDMSKQVNNPTDPRSPREMLAGKSSL